MRRIARVFPRKTEATPDDSLVFFGSPPDDISELADEAHVSVLFSYDRERGEKMYDTWAKKLPTKIGGVAFGDPGGDFVPGMYVKHGYTITSRGCPNRCWFCSVHRREGNIRELPIVDGWNLLDSNILACSDYHLDRVFEMLGRQKERAMFTGGLEAKILTERHVDMLWSLRPEQMFFAYDTPDDYEPLVRAGKMLRYADFTRRHLRCYVLVGWVNDTFDKAEKRLFRAWEAGFLPMAMLYRGEDGTVFDGWEKFQRKWARPAITKTIVRDAGIRMGLEVVKNA